MNDKAWFGKDKNRTEDLGYSAHVAHLLPDKLTQAGFWFLLQASKITLIFHSFQWMSKFVTSTEWQVEDYADYLLEEKQPFHKEAGFSFYDTLVLQMVWADEIHLSKIADALNSYLLDLIACAYRSKPTLVPSKARFDLEFVRRFRTINDAVRGSAMVELEKLSRSGFSEILMEAKRVSNCSLREVDEAELRKLIRLRNEIVHKQGYYPEIISSMFKKKAKPRPWLKHKPGDTKKAEITAARIVGLFEVAAIKNGIEKSATKKEIFKGTQLEGT
jgi:hypothetical protein